MSKSTKKASVKPSASKSSSSPERKPVLSIIKDIQRQTRRQYSVEEKIRIVLEGLQGEQSVAEICRREGLNGSGQPSQCILSLDRTAEAVRSFWKRAKNVWPVIRLEKLPLRKSIQ